MSVFKTEPGSQDVSFFGENNINMKELKIQKQRGEHYNFKINSVTNLRS